MCFRAMELSVVWVLQCHNLAREQRRHAICTFTVRKALFIHFWAFFFFLLVLHQFCRYCPIDCSRITPDLLQCMWEGKQTRFLQIYLSASYEGCNNCIYYSVELLGGYKNWCKMWIATIICREMHIKSFRKRFVFYKRPIGWYNNFQKWL